jgi:hypothetical protein
MRRVAAPFIAFWLSKSYFTISVPSRYIWTCRGG